MYGVCICVCVCVLKEYFLKVSFSCQLSKTKCMSIGKDKNTESDFRPLHPGEAALLKWDQCLLTHYRPP